MSCRRACCASSANEVARALISMMARSTKGSNRRPDTLMQDRTSANSMKVLLQRTAGPYIWVNCVGGDPSGRLAYVRFAPASGQIADISSCPLSAISDLMPCSENAPLFDHLVGGNEQTRWHGQGECLRRFQVDDRFVLSRRLYRKVGRLGALQDVVDIIGRLPMRADA